MTELTVGTSGRKVYRVVTIEVYAVVVSPDGWLVDGYTRNHRQHCRVLNTEGLDDVSSGSFENKNEIVY